MLETGTRVEMTKGYKGVKGVITETTDSPYEFYVVRLDNEINIVVGPSAFIVEQDIENKMTEPKAKVCHYTEVPAEVFGDEAPGVTIRWVINEKDDGAPNYVLRVIEVAAGGRTPDHIHSFEHENFIIEGKGRVQIDGEWHEVRPGDVVFVPPGTQHTYVNMGDETFKFLCGIPASRLTPKG